MNKYTFLQVICIGVIGCAVPALSVAVDYDFSEYGFQQALDNAADTQNCLVFADNPGVNTASNSYEANVHDDNDIMTEWTAINPAPVGDQADYRITTTITNVNGHGNLYGIGGTSNRITTSEGGHCKDTSSMDELFIRYDDGTENIRSQKRIDTNPDSSTGDLISNSVTVEFISPEAVFYSDDIVVSYSSGNTAGKAFESTVVVFLDEAGAEIGSYTYNGYHSNGNPATNTPGDGTAAITASSEVFTAADPGVVNMADPCNPASGTDGANDNHNVTASDYVGSGVRLGGYRIITYLEDVALVDSDSGTAGCQGVFGNNTTTNTQFINRATGMQVPDTLPVTLSYMHAEQSSSGLRIRWRTVAEIDNIGFNLYGDLAGHWVQLNDHLVASAAINSLEEQSYTILLPGQPISRIQLEDVATNGRRQRHGPFTVNQEYGESRRARRINWRQQRRVLAGERRLKLSAGTHTNARLDVSKSGLQQIEHADLLAAGVDLSGIKHQRIGISDQGRAIARWISDPDGDGRWSSGDRLSFIGTVQKTLYSAKNSYILHSDGRKVHRAEQRHLKAKGSLNKVVRRHYSHEPNSQYSFAALGADPWYDTDIRAIRGPVTLNRHFDLDGYIDAPATLVIEGWGVTDFPGNQPDHHLIVSLNNVVITAECWVDGVMAKHMDDGCWFDGHRAFQIRAELPAGLLRARANTLRIDLPHDLAVRPPVGWSEAYDIIALDRFSIDYAADTRLTNANAWSTVVAAGEYVLLDVGQAGKNAVTVWAQNGTARQAYIAQVEQRDNKYLLPAAKNEARHFWVTRQAERPEIHAGVPGALKRTARKTNYLIITHPFFQGSALQELVSLQQARGYRVEVVDVERIYAAYSDHQPSAAAIDAFIDASAVRGRLDKVLLLGGSCRDTLGYENSACVDYVPTHYLAVGSLVTYAPSDTLYGDIDGDHIPDLAVGRWPLRTRDDLSRLLNKQYEYQADHSGLFVSGTDGFGVPHGDMSAALTDWSVDYSSMDDQGERVRQRLLDAFNDPQGIGLISMLGHTSYAVWNFNPILLRGSDAANLTGAPTVVTQWGCWNSYFVHPAYDTLAQALLLDSTAGAVATVGSSSLGNLNSYITLGRVFFEKLDQGGELGEILLSAQREIAQARPGLIEELLIINNLGDPALQMGH
ncbi:MAG: hypothetical protein CSA09_00955 [Candidatus Contendobacter odensis]|uniref:Gingipain domain-containing protein n=1 Tax=Candidatus Contendibacter odensensis TaxID=1400860 RepID=A0A2G6PFX8_9GAMM|nr:MAG: hypothetical protein CSA09_00955 [Candidatus Contendobacter odensis]